MVPSFFFTKSTGEPQGKTLGQMKPLSTRSCNLLFNSFNSIGTILYGGIEMETELDNNSNSNSNSQSGGRLGNFLKNTYGNSRTNGTLSKVTFEKDLSTTCV